MKAVIFTGGTIERETVAEYFRKESPELVVAADSGLEFCYHAGIRPDYIVGDFDSIRPEILAYFRGKKEIPMDTYRPEKDMTDTDIALEKAVQLGADSVVFFGATGTRLDHTLSNIFNLIILKERGIRAWILDAHNRIYLPPDHELILRREDMYGKYLSLFPVRKEVRGLTMEGFCYPLEGRTLQQGDGGLCVSNQLSPQAEEGRIRWESGDLLVMETRD